ncbi:MAG: hypothetical protein ACI4AD_11825 [Roseburia sp.]
MMKLQGSLTIEASMIIPLVLFVFVLAIQGEIRLHEETREIAIAISCREKPNVLKGFYQSTLVEELIHGENED